MRRAFVVTAVLVVAAAAYAPGAAAQLRPSPLSPETPKWSQVARLSDGRVFVTDGNIVLDTSFAKPVALPSETVGTAWLQSFLSSAQPNETRFRDLTLKIRAVSPVYVAPTGTIMNPTYVDYVRSVFGESSLSFRYNGTLDPMQIVWNNAVVGALMPMKP